MLWADIKYDISWPKELLLKQTQYMIDTTGNEVVRQIRRNIMENRSVYGGGLAPLKDNTIKRKKGMRYPSKALYAKGILSRAIHYYKRGLNAGNVGIIARGSPNRRLVGIVQQTGNYHGGIPRPFFGISKKTWFDIAGTNGLWERWLARITSHATPYLQGTFKP